jgi:4-amino-4-deoxy-L-arabinose transferase-like glycosyltransferase
MRLGNRIAVCLFLAALTLPFAGNYGLWDPWESNYTEVSREILQTGDWVTLHDRRSSDHLFEFWSKPPLLFWSVAAALKVSGIHPTGEPAAELARSWRVEWAARLPVLLFALWAVFALWRLLDAIVGRAAAWLGAVILSTSSQWLLLSRQTMTDIPFVACMTVALCYFARALLLPADAAEAPLPRRRIARISWPDSSSFYGLITIVAVGVICPLAVIFTQLEGTVVLAGHSLSATTSLVPYAIAVGAALVWAVGARSRRQLYLYNAYVCCGLAALAKGPAGVVLPAMVILLFIVVRRRLSSLFRLELARGFVLVVAAACPWYQAMAIRHGSEFFAEFIGEQYLQRAAGRNGDRGSFEYYGLWLLRGLFPWSGLAAASIVRSLRDGGGDEDADGRKALQTLALVWLLVELAIISVVSTKFHHYVLPLLPPIAILAALTLQALQERDRFAASSLVAIGVPVTVATGARFAMHPIELLWLFDYDYVRQPGGFPWPAGAAYDFTTAIAVAGVAMAALLTMAALRPSDTSASPRVRGSLLLLLAVVPFAAALAFAGAGDGPARWLWPLPALAAVLVLASRPERGSVGRWIAGATIAAVAWSAFLADRVLVAVSAHWSQKRVVESYYATRASKDEPLLAFELDWHGERIYTKNALMAPWTEPERTVFCGPTAGSDLQQYLGKHKGRRMFFVLRRDHLDRLRELLPPSGRETLHIQNDSNDKLYLVDAYIGAER